MLPTSLRASHPTSIAANSFSKLSLRPLSSCHAPEYDLMTGKSSEGGISPSILEAWVPTVLVRRSAVAATLGC